MSKEFFTGGREVQEAKSTIKRLSSQTKLSARQSQSLAEARRISRRHSLRLLGSVVGLTAISGSGATALLLNGEESQSQPETQTTILPEQDFINIPLSAQTPRQEEARNFQAFDRNYAKKLLRDYQKPNKENLQTIWRALAENIAYVQLVDVKGPGTIGEGTALRLCESGYYLTASHLFMEEQEDEFVPAKVRSHVYLPTSGVLAPIRSIIFDPTCDLAIFFAPSGKNRSKIEDLRIVASQLVSGQKLWQLGIQVEIHENTVKANLGIPFGTVAQNPRIKNYLGEETYVLVRGMIPYGGSSGGPIIDTRGNIVAVESGAFIETNDDKTPLNQRGNYTHSIISPLTNLERLNGLKVHDLPYN